MTNETIGPKDYRPGKAYCSCGAEIPNVCLIGDIGLCTDCGKVWAWMNAGLCEFTPRYSIHDGHNITVEGLAKVGEVLDEDEGHTLPRSYYEGHAKGRAEGLKEGLRRSDANDATYYRGFSAGQEADRGGYARGYTLGQKHVMDRLQEFLEDGDDVYEEEDR